MKIYACPYVLLLAVSMTLLSSCVNHPDVPSSFREAESLPAIFPDYCNVTVPCNIAPLNFMLPADQYEACVARFTTPDGQQQTYGNGVKVQIPEDEWKSMLRTSEGKSIKVEVWARCSEVRWRGGAGGAWIAFSPFEIRVAKDSIDEYVSYRLIEPSYVAWTYMEIAQRNLTSFDESQVFNNEITMIDREKGQCINCHSYQNYKTDNMLFHVRLSNAGTVVVDDGRVSRVSLKRPYTISGGAYPSWHPTAKLIAFAACRTRQAFHTANPNKIEVYDEASDMILYDVKTDSVSIVCNDTTTLEVYPTWSPDGKYLYYCKSVPLPEEMRGRDIRTTYSKIQYNLVRRSFDLATHGFGEEELVYDAASADKSVSLPRISPDGRYLLFALGRYGCFHSRHHDADIVCIPMEGYSGTTLTWETASPVDLASVNSEGYSDSYPSWSSNGHWMMFASRRDDDNYSRIYFAYFNNGTVGKAFMMPQEDPEIHTFLLKSYNRPEFMVEPVRISVGAFSRVFDK